MAENEHRRVLFAVDASPYCSAAVDAAAASLLGPRDHVTLLHVVDFTPVSVASPLAAAVGELNAKAEQQVKESGRALLHSVAERLSSSVAHIHTALLLGNAKHSVVAYATENKFDLCLVSSRGLGAVKRVVLGSVSDHVVHHAPCTVVVIKAGAEDKE